MFFYKYKINDFYFTLVEDKGFLVSVSLDNDDALGIKHETEVLKLAAKELQAYLDGNLKKFSVPIKAEGTEFQSKVWKALRDIPFGETRSYKDIAIEIGNPKAYRAVGNANGKNPLLIIVPCHRVIGTGGDMGGFSYGVQLKRTLLELEKGH